jgi:fructose 5-dehydrogenase small subunit
MSEPAAPLPPDLSRRQLLAFAALLGSASLPPLPLAAEEVKKAAQQMGLDEFMTLSRLLTGAADLSRDLGRIYLGSLEGGSDGDAALVTLWGEVGFREAAPPRSIQQLAETGVFKRENLDKTAKAILKFWYTGIYETENGPKVAEYTDTLAWRAVGYTTAPSNCGGPTGFWADPPPDARNAEASPG